jgi:hypothetical protein
LDEKETIVVDGANVAHEVKAKSGKARTSSLAAMRKTLIEMGFRPIIIVDAKLRHDIDDPDQLEKMFDQREVLQAPAGTDADYFVLETAKREEAKIVSNDRFQDYQDKFEGIREKRVPYMIVNDEIQLYAEKLEDDAA